jgi:hypothetical protein
MVTANDSYNAFWADFKPIYDSHFPKFTVRANKNKQKICNFLTPELLTANKATTAQNLYCITNTRERSKLQAI